MLEEYSTRQGRLESSPAFSKEEASIDDDDTVVVVTIEKENGRNSGCWYRSKILAKAHEMEGLREIEAIDKAATNEDLFNAQNRLRELCATVVEESVSIMNYEGTPFELKGNAGGD